MKIKIKWDNRYSDSDEPDKMGRWARIGYIEHKTKDPTKRIKMSWISKVNYVYIAYLYLGEGGFKMNFSNLEDAKQYCENTINEFRSEYFNLENDVDMVTSNEMTSDEIFNKLPQMIYSDGNNYFFYLFKGQSRILTGYRMNPSEGGYYLGKTQRSGKTLNESLRKLLDWLIKFEYN